MAGTSSDPRRQIWEAGDYSSSVEQSVLVGEILCESVVLRAGERVLDVACGTGVTSFSAARRKATVTGVDFSTSALTAARRRADLDGLPVEFQEGNAEALAFPDESFDVVLSTFGAQFVGDQEAAARELVRVCKPGGRIGLANWTPAPFFGHFFKLMADYAPRQMKKSPTPETPGVLWGTRDRLDELFGDLVEFTSIQERISRSRYRSVDEWLDQVTGGLGPAVTILEQIDEDTRRAFVTDLQKLPERLNQVPGPDVLLESRYLEAVMVRR